MRTDENAENDAMMRKGISNLYRIEKENKARKDKLKEEGVKEDLMKFIFGESDYNPLRDKEKKDDE